MNEITAEDVLRMSESTHHLLIELLKVLQDRKIITVSDLVKITTQAKKHDTKRRK